MTLIVAIEPDRRQATYLSAMVRGKLKAELVLADSAEGALRALGNRVPDVILTSALLSPKDEGVIADWLRTLDAAAAHIQTLTIPMFAASRPATTRQRARGVLAALMGSDDDDAAGAPDGCDPAMFAEQCADYLARARAERASHDDDIPEPEEMVIAMKSTERVDAAAPHAAEAPRASAGPAYREPPPDDFVEFDLSRLLDTTDGAPVDTPAPQNSEPPARTNDDPPPAPAGDDVWVPPRLGVNRLWPAMEIPESSPRSAAPSPQPPARRVPRGRRPVQDEWGFFDPEQCGFAALLAKLAEITEGDDPPAKRPA